MAVSVLDVQDRAGRRRIVLPPARGNRDVVAVMRFGRQDGIGKRMGWLASLFEQLDAQVDKSHSVALSHTPPPSGFPPTTKVISRPPSRQHGFGKKKCGSKT